MNNEILSQNKCKETDGFIMSVRPYVDFLWTKFFSNSILEIFTKLSKKKQIFSQNLKIIINTLHENLHNFMTYSWISPGLKGDSEIN
jgi:hypothetical protein